MDAEAPMDDESSQPTTAGGGSPRRTSRRELMLEALLDTAARLFSERGYGGTSLQDIADELGVTRSALYHYVKSKEELLARLVTEVSSSQASKFLALRDNPELAPGERLRIAIAEVARGQAERPGLFRLLDRSEAELPPEVAAAHRKDKRLFVDAIIGIIRDGVLAGEFKPVDPKPTAFALLGMSLWVAWWYDPGGPSAPEEIGEQVAELAVSALTRTADRRPTEAGARGALALLRSDLAFLEAVLDEAD